VYMLGTPCLLMHMHCTTRPCETAIHRGCMARRRFVFGISAEASWTILPQADRGPKYGGGARCHSTELQTGWM